MRPWYLRWWGIVIVVYLACTAALGIVFVVVSRQARARAVLPDVLRVGGFTDTGKAEQPTRASAPIIVPENPTFGASSASAQLTIVEFSDFECPFCRQAFPIIRAAMTTYGTSVRFVYRHFPIDELHPRARRAAEAGACANAQGKFWAYHDKLFTNADALDDASLIRYARQVGLDQRFDVCLASKEFAGVVQADVDAGKALGVHGTPTWFFILHNDPLTARRVEGVIPRDALTNLINRVATP